MLPTASWPRQIRPGESVVKRILDISIASLLIILLCPLMLVVSMLILCTSRGPILYRQKRVGKEGRHFFIYKFRTMYRDADRRGPSVTSADDERVTLVGRMLRNNKLDELPQLFNVVRGDMSLVGPRPQVPRFVAHFDPSLRSIVLCVRPGITGPTALYFRHEERMLAARPDREGFYIRHILPVKLRMDAQYVMNQSLRGDLGVLLETARLISLAILRRLLCIPPNDDTIKQGKLWAPPENPNVPTSVWSVSVEPLSYPRHSSRTEKRNGNGNGNGREYAPETEVVEAALETAEES